MVMIKEIQVNECAGCWVSPTEGEIERKITELSGEAFMNGRECSVIKIGGKYLGYLNELYQKQSRQGHALKCYSPPEIKTLYTMYGKYKIIKSDTECLEMIE